MPEFEFVVNGPPFSVNSANTRKRAEWQIQVNQAAKSQWEREGRDILLPVAAPISVVITTYYSGLRIDVDNVIKPILDSLDGKSQEAEMVKNLLGKRRREGISWFVLYHDDNQVYKVTSERVDLKLSETLVSPSVLLEKALLTATELVDIVVSW